MQVTTPMAMLGHHLRRRGSRNDFWLILIQRTTASAAKTVICTELDQKAAITTDNFPGIYRGKVCSHFVWEGQSRLSLEPKITEFQLMRI
jgi:hypothetical protein